MASSNGAGLGTRAFLNRVADRVRARLDATDRHAKLYRRWTMLQVHFGPPKVHYEVWVQVPRRQVELGLHFEATEDMNGWLLRRFSDEMLAVRDELGSDFELEQWTKRWGRIHTYVRFDKLDDALAAMIADRMVSTIACLQPRLEALLEERPPDGKREVARRRR